MSHKPKVVVDCSEGYKELGFKSREAAESWIKQFEEARQRNSRMCSGEHTIREEDPSEH